MSRIRHVFETCSSENRAALLIYLCGGDPSEDESVERILAATKAGADIIELGMPFSDPSADGVTIQKASERALTAGATMKSILRIVSKVRQSSDVPILLFGYLNPILQFGPKALASALAQAGGDGFLTVDLPLEECECVRGPAISHGLDFVPLVAPTTSDERIKKIGEVATSFIYSVSMNGVTGTAAVRTEVAAERAARVRSLSQRPVAVGFGIRTGADAARLSPHSDGVVVGSAVVQAGLKDGAKGVGHLVEDLAANMGRPQS